MSWPSDNRNPHVAYVVYDTELCSYINFFNTGSTGNKKSVSTCEHICYATMFPTCQQAYNEIDNTNFSDFDLSFFNLVVKKVVLG